MCRLIPLDKNLGLRSTGVSESLRRIIRKDVDLAIKEEVISSVKSLQVCAGHEAGCEAAIHAMDSMFKDENTDAALLIDAKNAFNLVNREAFIRNFKITFLTFAKTVSNCYSSLSSLFHIGGDELKSEGATEGDTIAIIVYAIATISLILMIIEIMHDHPGNTSKLEPFLTILLRQEL